jgi:hypothetical protein
MTVLYKRMFEPTSRSILMITIADELWYVTQTNGDRRHYWFSLARVEEANQPDSHLWQFLLFGINIAFTKF